MNRGSGKPVARHAGSSRAVHLDLEDSHRSRAISVKPALYAVTPRNRGANHEVSIDVSTAACKHVTIRLPRPSAPLQSITATTSLLSLPVRGPALRQAGSGSTLGYRRRPLRTANRAFRNRHNARSSSRRLCTVVALPTSRGSQIRINGPDRPRASPPAAPKRCRLRVSLIRAWRQAARLG